MTVWNALLNNTMTESPVPAEALTDGWPWPDMQPLWANVTEIQAVVTETIAPQLLGRVKFQGTRWRALSDRPYPLTAGTVVQVIGRQRSNILVVEPVEQLP